MDENEKLPSWVNKKIPTNSLMTNQTDPTNVETNIEDTIDSKNPYADGRFTFNEFSWDAFKEPRFAIELVTLGTDLYSAVASFVPGPGTTSAAVADLGGGIVSAGVDVYDGHYWDAAKTMFASLLSSGSTLVSGPASNTVRFAKIASSLNKSKKLIPLVMTGLGALGMYSLGDSLFSAVKHARGEHWVEDENGNGRWEKSNDVQFGIDDIKAVLSAISTIGQYTNSRRISNTLNGKPKITEDNVTANSSKSNLIDNVAVKIEDAAGKEHKVGMRNEDVEHIENNIRNSNKGLDEKINAANKYARERYPEFPGDGVNGEYNGGFKGIPTQYTYKPYEGNWLSEYTLGPIVRDVQKKFNIINQKGNVSVDPKVAQAQGLKQSEINKINNQYSSVVEKNLEYVEPPKNQQKTPKTQDTQTGTNTKQKSTMSQNTTYSIKNNTPSIIESDGKYSLSIKNSMGNTIMIPINTIKRIDGDKIIVDKNNKLSNEEQNKIIEIINNNFGSKIPMHQMGGQLNYLSVDIPELKLNHVPYPKSNIDSYQGIMDGYASALASTDFTDKDELGLPNDMPLYQLDSPYLSRTKANPSKPIAPFNHVQDPVNYTERGRTGVARLFNEMYPLLDAGRSNYFNKKIADKSKGFYNYTEDSPILKTSQSISSFPQMQIAHDKAAKLYRHANSIQSSDYDALNSSRNSLYNEGDNALMVGDLQTAETFAKNVAQAHQNAEDNRMINYQTHMSNAQKRDMLHNTFNEIDQRVYNQRAANNQAALNQFFTNKERNRLEDVAVNKEILDLLSSQHNANNNNIYEFNKKYYINAFRKANPEFANRSDDDVVQAILGNIEYVPARGFDANKFRSNFINNVGLNVDPKSEIDEKLYNFALSHSGNSYRYNDAIRRMLKMLNESRMNLLDLKLKDNNNG